MIVYVVNGNSSYISSEFDILEAGQVLYKWRKNFMKKIMRSFLVALAVLMVLAVPVDVDAASIKLNKKKMTIYVGQSVTLKVKGAKKKKVKWKSSKKKIAKVTNKGKVTGCKVGKATITAKVGKKSLKCKVVVKKKTTKMTAGQRNALARAKSYLAYSAFSKKGLKDQLLYERYSNSDAQYAVDHCGADWNTQAYLKAKSYLSFMSFSRDGLIDQLEFEGFTHSQAVYGADRAYK